MKTNAHKKSKVKNCFFFNSTELNPKLLITRYTMQKQSTFKLSLKVTQSTCIFIDKCRLNSILKSFFSGFRMQGAFWGLYLYNWKIFREKKEIFFTHPSIHTLCSYSWNHRPDFCKTRQKFLVACSIIEKSEIRNHSILTKLIL